MQCPYCGSDSSVTETRDAPEGVRRRRVCGTCKRRFTTYERVGAPGLRVEKRDGSVEPFDAGKLARALERVTAHRSAVTPDDLHRIVRDVEATLVDSGSRTTRWSDLTRLLLERLAAIDRVSADRLRANYVDDDGRVRLDDPEPTEQPPPQLGLFTPGGDTSDGE